MKVMYAFFWLLNDEKENVCVGFVRTINEAASDYLLTKLMECDHMLMEQGLGIAVLKSLVWLSYLLMLHPWDSSQLFLDIFIAEMHKIVT